jgi:uncharacterized protein (DUF1501 family)
MRLQQATRRRFLGQVGALSAMCGGAAPLALNLAALGSASAQTASDYKALVCIFLYGGNDSFNMVLATDPDSFANYSAVRTQAPDTIALLAPGTAPVTGAALGSPARLGGVLPIAPANAQGRSFALHPSMAALRTLFDDEKRLAIVPNVGPLVMPTTKAQYANGAHPKPKALFSHNDQANTWMALAPEGATRGWGGRMADLLASQNARPVFTAVSAAGNAVWLAGQSVQQFQVSSSGAIRVGADSGGRVYGSAAVAAALERVVSTASGGHLLEADLAALARRTVESEVALRSALKSAGDPLFGTPQSNTSYNPANDPRLIYANPASGGNAFNGLAQQLQTVARMIDAAGAVGARRQVFFVGIGGFDTHDNQNRSHAGLMAQLAHAMRYFDDVLGALGARDKVTTFTASDFGRTFTSNGDGTDHGWGSHQFVMGGAVRGGDLYGRFPVLGAKNANDNNFNGSPDQIGNGSLLPSVSVDQLGATLGRWFGVGNGDLATIFPNLANFGPQDLGFMRA